MAIFAILMPTPQPALAGLVRELFPDDYLDLNDTQILISASGTTEMLTKQLGMMPAEQGKSAVGNAVVVKVSSYYGRAPTAIWDWMKTKMESLPLGG